MEEILVALKKKLKEQEKSTDTYWYRCGIYDCIVIVQELIKKQTKK